MATAPTCCRHNTNRTKPLRDSEFNHVRFAAPRGIESGTPPSSPADNQVFPTWAPAYRRLVDNGECVCDSYLAENARDGSTEEREVAILWPTPSLGSCWRPYAE